MSFVWVFVEHRAEKQGHVANPYHHVMAGNKAWLEFWRGLMVPHVSGRFDIHWIWEMDVAIAWVLPGQKSVGCHLATCPGFVRASFGSSGCQLPTTGLRPPGIEISFGKATWPISVALRDRQNLFRAVTTCKTTKGGSHFNQWGLNACIGKLPKRHLLKYKTTWQMPGNPS